MKATMFGKHAFAFAVVTCGFFSCAFGTSDHQEPNVERERRSGFKVNGVVELFHSTKKSLSETNDQIELLNAAFEKSLDAEFDFYKSHLNKASQYRREYQFFKKRLKKLEMEEAYKMWRSEIESAERLEGKIIANCQRQIELIQKRLDNLDIR